MQLCHYGCSLLSIELLRNRECIEKGSDAQSSCTKPDLEPEEANLGHKQDLTQQKQNKSLITDITMQKFDQCVKESTHMLMHEGLPAVPNTTDMMTLSRDNMAADGQWECAIVSSEAFKKNSVRADCSREAIDLIGSFDESYFQINAVFADHESSELPLDVPKTWLSNLPKRSLHCGKLQKEFVQIWSLV